MQVTTVTATVRFSQDTGKGAWKSLELGAEATISPGESWRVAQANLYRDLGHQLKTLWKQNGSAAPQDAAEDSQVDDPPTAHFCEVHQMAFTAREGKYGTFYSHPIEGSHTWCNESKGGK
jgi:hypothetical protein